MPNNRGRIASTLSLSAVGGALIAAALSTVIAQSGVAAPAAAAPACPVSASTSLTPEQTISAFKNSCTQRQIDSLYRSLTPGVAPQNTQAQEQMRLLGPSHPVVTDAIGVVFHGKNFYTNRVSNRVGPGEVFEGEMSLGTSKFDGKPAHVIDYAEQGVPVTDEFRTLDNGVAIGFGYVGGHRAVNFWVWK